VNAVSRITPEYIDAVAETEEQRVSEEQRAYLPGASILDPSGNLIIDGTGMEEELLRGY
jgi:aliphatic nitrilase